MDKSQPPRPQDDSPYSPYQNNDANRAPVSQGAIGGQATASDIEPATTSTASSPFQAKITVDPQPVSDKRSFVANAYLPEYLLMLISLGSILAAINTLVTYGIDAIGKSTASASSYDPFGAASSLSMILSLATLAAFIPFFVVLYLRTRNSERVNPLIRAHRWRKGFLGTFIVLQLLTIVGSFIGMFYSLFSRFIPQVSLYGSDGSSADGPVWKPIVTALVHALLTGLVVWVVTRDYRQSREVK